MRVCGLHGFNKVIRSGDRQFNVIKVIRLMRTNEELQMYLTQSQQSPLKAKNRFTLIVSQVALLVEHFIDRQFQHLVGGCYIRV